MAIVKDILRYIESIAPPSMKEDWDNVGINCGHENQQVHKILVALDPFAGVCQEAKEIGADLLVTHHALIWEQGFITDQTEQGRNTLFLIENGIAHINAHTNLDCAPGGVNDALAATLGLENTESLGAYGGMMRCGPAAIPSSPPMSSTTSSGMPGIWGSTSSMPVISPPRTRWCPYWLKKSPGPSRKSK